MKKTVPLLALAAVLSACSKKEVVPAAPDYADFINVGDIHSCEPWLYSECLQENITVRAQAWRQAH